MKKTGICALACALAVGLSFTGCADTTWALKDGDITIPTGVYVYYLVNNAKSVQSYTSSAAAASSKGSSSASKDMWSQTIGKTNAASWAMDNALSCCKELAVVEKQCAARKLVLSSSDKSSASSEAANNFNSYSALMTKNGISQSSIQRVANDMYLEQLLFDSYYGPKGDKAVSESDIDSYYTKNYVHVKQIFVAKFDSGTKAALTGAKLTAATEKAKKALAQAKADPKNFDKYVKQYNEDPGMTENPDGYTFSKSSSQNYDAQFTKLAFSLKDGEVGMAESSMGYFIEYKLPTDPKSPSFTASTKEGILTAMKGTEFQELITDTIKSEKFQQNESTLNHYSPRKLNLSAS